MSIFAYGFLIKLARVL